MTFFERTRLTTRLAAAALLVGAVGWALGSAVIRSSADRTLQDEAERSSLVVAERLADDLDARVVAFARVLRVVASDALVGSLDTDAETELAVAMRSEPDLSSLVLRDVEGIVAAGVAADRLVTSDNAPDRADLIGSIGPGGYRIDLLSGSGDANELEIIVPVEQPPGTVVGTLEGTIPLELLVRSLGVRELSRSAKAVVVAPGGDLLDHPERQRIIDGESYPIDELARQGNAGVLDRDGVDVIAAAATPDVFPGLVVIERDETEVLAAASRELSRLGVLVAIVIAATVVAVLVVGNRLTRPLTDLVGAVRRLAAGDRAARATVAGSAELRLVATEVNRMADSLDHQLAELERADAELRSAEERFRTAFDAAPVPMVLQDAMGTVLGVNPAWTELSGRDIDELLGQSWEVLPHPDELDALVAAFEGAMSEGRRVFRCESRFLRADGTELPVLVSVAIVPAQDGSPAAFIAHVVDLSGLREAEARFRQIVESSPDVLAILTVDGTVELVSRRVNDMFGYEPDELVGKPIELLVPRCLVAAPAEVDGLERDLVGIRRDRSELPVAVEVTETEVGGQPRLLVAVRDVAERRRGEEATRQLAEMQLLQRQAMEINDNVVQGLTIARWSFELDRPADGLVALERTLESAHQLVDSMLAASGDIEPGALRRQRPAVLEP